MREYSFGPKDHLRAFAAGVNAASVGQSERRSGFGNTFLARYFRLGWNYYHAIGPLPELWWREPSEFFDIAERQMKKSRENPDLVVLFNPLTIPDERRARESWSRFHLRSGGGAKVRSIKDIPGLPKTVVALGICEAIEFTSERRRGAPSEEQEYGRSEHSPWLVADSSMKRLWVVSDVATFRASDFPWPSGYVKAVVYFPPKNSGKHHSAKAFRHEFGETGERGRPSSEWPRFYPAFKVVGGGRAIALIRPRGGYTVEERGIVG